MTGGTFGSLEYPDVYGTDQDLWINWNSSDEPGTDLERIPVPKYYWKVLYDPQSHSAVAFLGQALFYGHLKGTLGFFE